VLNPFGLLASLENAYILVLFVVGLMRYGLGCFRQPVLLWALITLLVWGSAYGFASYQNLGSAFRFRAQVAPILLLLGLYFTYMRHLTPQRFLRSGSRHAPTDETEPLAADPQR